MAASSADNTVLDEFWSVINDIWHVQLDADNLVIRDLALLGIRCMKGMLMINSGCSPGHEMARDAHAVLEIARAVNARAVNAQSSSSGTTHGEPIRDMVVSLQRKRKAHNLRERRRKQRRANDQISSANVPGPPPPPLPAPHPKFAVPPPRHNDENLAPPPPAPPPPHPKLPQLPCHSDESLAPPPPALPQLSGLASTASAAPETDVHSELYRWSNSVV